MIVSESTALWFFTLMVIGNAVLWGYWDGCILVRLWKNRKERHDEVFGAFMGLAIMVIGVTGMILQHLSP